MTLSKKTCERCGSSYQPTGPAQKLCDECWRIKTCDGCGAEFVLPPREERTKNRAGRKLCDRCCADKRGAPKREQAQRRHGDKFTCRDCHRQFPVSESVKDASRSRGIMERCHECDRKRKKSHREGNEVQRVRVQSAMRALKRERKAAGLHWSDSLTDEQLAAKRAYSRKRSRLARWAEIGASQEYYDQRFAHQNGLCDICLSPTPRRGDGQDEVFCIDHDHENGGLRSLLCVDCNLMIAHAQENLENLRRAVGYLEDWHIRLRGR